MRAYLIDPLARSVTEVDYNGDIHQIYEFIHADVFDTCRINAHGDEIFVDDMGLMKEQTVANFFCHENYPQPLAGRGLVLGCDDDGETTAPVASIEEVTEQISFGLPQRYWP